MVPHTLDDDAIWWTYDSDDDWCSSAGFIITLDHQIIHCPYMVDPAAGPLGQPMVYEYTFLVDLGLLDPMRHLSFNSGHFWQWLMQFYTCWPDLGLISQPEQQGPREASSPRALMMEGVVQPLVITIYPPSRRAWWAQMDSASTLGGSFGTFTVPEAVKKWDKVVTEEIDLGNWGKVLAFGFHRGLPGWSHYLPVSFHHVGISRLITGGHLLLDCHGFWGQFWSLLLYWTYFTILLCLGVS